jgi:hypothetical protein
MLIFKNIFCFGLAFSAYNWLTQGSVTNTFVAIASIQVFVCLLSVPMCRSSEVGESGKC